jgi:hypothetical protein
MKLMRKSNSHPSRQQIIAGGQRIEFVGSREHRIRHVDEINERKEHRNHVNEMIESKEHRNRHVSEVEENKLHRLEQTAVLVQTNTMIVQKHVNEDGNDNPNLVIQINVNKVHRCIRTLQDAIAGKCLVF